MLDFLLPLFALIRRHCEQITSIISADVTSQELANGVKFLPSKTATRPMSKKEDLGQDEFLLIA